MVAFRLVVISCLIVCQTVSVFAQSDLPADRSVFTPSIGQLSPGVISGNLYTNDALGFRYQFPAGWIVEDEATQAKITEAGRQFVWGDNPSAAREHQLSQQCERTLLSVTKYPQGTQAEGIQPLIAVMAFDSECSPITHFPALSDDPQTIKGAIKQLAERFAGLLEGGPVTFRGDKFGKAFALAGHLVLEISASLGVKPPGSNLRRTVYTSLDFTEAKSYFVAWIFVSGSQAELRELRNTGISFNESSSIASPPIPVSPSF
jgi:hypothetical protein